MSFSKIEFKPKEKITKDFTEEETDLISDYLSALFHNGQISIDYNVVITDDCIFAYVSQANSDSLDEKYNSCYAAKRKEKIDLTYEVSYEKIGTSIYKSDVCTCESPSYYMLITDYISPVSCGDCGNIVPLYKLPFISTYGMGDTFPQEDHYNETSWLRDYKAVDRLWMACLADRWTGRQLADPQAQLSKVGREICAKIEKVTGKKTYYYLLDHVFFHEMSNGKPKPPQKQCPLCGIDWREEKPKESDTYLFCDNCRLSTKKHW